MSGLVPQEYRHTVDTVAYDDKVQVWDTSEGVEVQVTVGNLLPVGLKGTATVANETTSIAVTHGYDGTPDASEIQVTPTLLSSAASWWVSDIGDTTFTINVNADPGAGTATFAWRIRV